MSYEGYIQYLCKRRHYNSFDVYDDPKRCEYCGEKMIWANGVDQTNGSYDEDGSRIDGYVELELLFPEEVVNGEFHPAVYEVPKGVGYKPR